VCAPSAGIPLNFSKHQERKFALSINSKSATAWSQTITVDYPGLPEFFVKLPLPENLPVATPPSASAASATREGVSLQQAGRSKSFIVDKRLKGDAAVDAAEWQGNSVVLRASMQVHSPGCLHIVLHSIGCDPPFLLQNRTSEDFVFRQEGTADRWHVISAYSAVGFAWPFTDGAPSEPRPRSRHSSFCNRIASQCSEVSFLLSPLAHTALYSAAGLRRSQEVGNCEVGCAATDSEGDVRV
jgi:hypothetical protein